MFYGGVFALIFGVLAYSNPDSFFVRHLDHPILIWCVLGFTIGICLKPVKRRALDGDYDGFGDSNDHDGLFGLGDSDSDSGE